MSNQEKSVQNSIKTAANFFRFRGYTLQFFLITILPLTILLLLVALGSQSLHHEAMRNLVGDRDLETVRAAASSISRELAHVSSTIQIISRDVPGKTDFDSLILAPNEIADVLDGGFAVYSDTNELYASSESNFNWANLPNQLAGLFSRIRAGESQPVFSDPLIPDGSAVPFVFVGTHTSNHRTLIGAFSPGRLIRNAIPDLASSTMTTVLVTSRSQVAGSVKTIYRSGTQKQDENSPSHPGVKEALNGESGINYFKSNAGEHVVAFAPIASTGWGLVTEEAWEDMASPYLKTTQYAPLAIVPAFLLALVTLWFSVRRIVTPLGKLEKQAASLANGDFDAIHQPVGGIQEIQNLQKELSDMADRLQAAQAGLRSYIGAITDGIENERRNLARELHDETIQSMIALNQRIQMMGTKIPAPQKKNLVELQNLVQQSIDNLRRLIKGLRPIYLEDLGLLTSLEMLANEIGSNNGLPISFSAKGVERRLDSQTEMTIYRMVQESLNNIVHHADASQASLQIQYGDQQLRIQTEDNGRGFVVFKDPNDFARKGHYGLLGLKERADIIGAELKILSSPGNGTRTIIAIPLPDKE